jgi:hypothetical protein
MKQTAIKELQREVCKRMKISFCPSTVMSKVGIAENVNDIIQPINGLRHPPKLDATGWYIWAGEQFSESPDFFTPLHVSHLNERCPKVKKYLGLPPGWRFLIANDYEDVWFDESLLRV